MKKLPLGAALAGGAASGFAACARLRARQSGGEQKPGSGSSIPALAERVTR